MVLLAFERVFAIIGFIFFASIPLVFLLENIKPGAKAGASALQHAE